MPNPTFNVEIKGMDEIKVAYKSSPEIVGNILAQAVARTPDILAKYTVVGIVPYRTGQLAQTFRRDVSGLTARWFPTVNYAPFVEFGTSPHIILPVNKEALFWPGASHPVKMVRHPGSKKNPFMERIISMATDEIDQTFVEAIGVIRDALSTQ